MWDAGVGIEGMAFDKRWMTHIKALRRKNQDSTQPQSDDAESREAQSSNLSLDKDMKLRQLRRPSKQVPPLKKEFRRKQDPQFAGRLIRPVSRTEEIKWKIQ